MLESLLLVVLLGLVLATLAVCVGIGLVLRVVAERSRLHPSIETGAPWDWYWSPTTFARLHRRLQSALLPIHPGRQGRRHRSGPHDSLTEMVFLIADQAVTVDRELIAASRLRGPARRAQARRLRVEVRKIEKLSHRVQRQRQLVAEAGKPPRDEVLADVESRLDLLAAAHSELTAIEQASTATDPDEVLRRIAPPPPPVVNKRPQPAVRPRHAEAPRSVPRSSR